MAEELTPVIIDKAFRKRLTKKSPKQQAAIARAITRLRQDPKHAGLRTHKLGGRDEIAARVSEGDRITFRWEGDTIVMLNHCTHGQVLGR